MDGGREPRNYFSKAFHTINPKEHNQTTAAPGPSQAVTPLHVTPDTRWDCDLRPGPPALGMLLLAMNQFI